MNDAVNWAAQLGLDVGDLMPLSDREDAAIDSAGAANDVSSDVARSSSASSSRRGSYSKAAGRVPCITTGCAGMCRSMNSSQRTLKINRGNA